MIEVQINYIKLYMNYKQYRYLIRDIKFKEILVGMNQGLGFLLVMSPQFMLLLHSMIRAFPTDRISFTTEIFYFE